MTTKNPWLGLASYEEPKNDGNDYLFCGRDEETLDLVRLIDNNLFITLYGSSGIGKTSLLRAGVIPILRRKDYFPLYVRLSQEPTEISYAEAIVRRLQGSGLTEEKGAAMRHPDGDDRLYLWNYFATTRFMKDDREVYPVVILDQFEEVFREGDKAKAELLLKQIYCLLNDELEMPDEEGYSADTNYRFVASIREDFLFVLEDSIDENSLDLYKDNRYRLRPMKPEQARQVVLVPGKDCIEEGEKDAIAEHIISLAKRSQSEDIDTLLLSIVCSGTYDKKMGEKIASSDLAVWKNNPMEVYYQDAVKGLSASQIRYIQQHLIREDGSRRRVDAEEVKASLGETTYRQLTQGKNRLFSIGDKGQVELLHDQLGMAVYEERKAFEERERKKKLRWRVGAISLILLAIAGIIFFQNYRLKQQRWKMMENQSRFIAKTANDLVNDGDSYTAQRLLMEIMPEDVNNPVDKPFTFETEEALRTATSHHTAILKGHSDNINSVLYSPDGKRIVSASDDGTVRIWDAENGAELRTLKGHTSGVCSASYSPDGKSIVSASRDETVRIWDAETGEELRTMERHTGWCHSACYSPDGKHIVSASSDRTVKIWDAETGVELRTLEGHTTGVIFVSYSPDGSRIVSTSYDGTVRVCDAETGTVLRTMKGHTEHVQSASYSPDGKRIVSVDGEEVRIWDAETGTELRTLEGQTLLFSSASFSPDGKRIISAGDGVRIWNVETGAELRTLESHTAWVNAASYSPDGKHIVSASSDISLRIWDVETGVELRTLEPHTSGVFFASYSPDGKRIVSASGDGVRIWDAETGVELRTLKGHILGARSALYSPDGKHIVSASGDSTVRIWDAETGAELRTLRIFYEPYFACFSPDGKCVVSANGDGLDIWDAETWKWLRTLNYCCHYMQRFSSFSPDGKRIATPYEHKVGIFDAEMGAVLRTLEGHTNYVFSASYSPDGKHIVSASLDGTIKIWDFPPLQDLIDQTRERFKDRPLTPEERRMYYLE